MKAKLKYLFVFLFSLTSLVVTAQDEPEEDDDDRPLLDNSPYDKNYYLISIRANVMVPHATANKSFRKTFIGMYEVGADVDVMLYKGLYIGGTYKNALLKTKGTDLKANMYINNVAGKIGADIFVGDKNRIIFSGSITVGESHTYYTGLASRNPATPPANTKFTTVYEEPALHLYFLTDENFGIGATLSYTIFNHTFDPYELKLTDWAAYEKAPSGSTQCISFGFGLYYNFVKKKK